MAAYLCNQYWITFAGQLHETVFRCADGGLVSRNSRATFPDRGPAGELSP